MKYYILSAKYPPSYDNRPLYVQKIGAYGFIGTGDIKKAKGFSSLEAAIKGRDRILSKGKINDFLNTVIFKVVEVEYKTTILDA